MSFASVLVIAASGLAIGLELSHTNRATPYYVNMTEIDWVDQNDSLLAVTPGANVSQGQLFPTSVTLPCLQGSSWCNGTHHVALHGTMGFGNWPSWVAPCGMFRVVFNVTWSNLPATIPPNGSTLVSLTLQAPDVSYPVQDPSFHYVNFDYTGHLDVYLEISSR